jgi:hypothetical protein
VPRLLQHLCSVALFGNDNGGLTHLHHAGFELKDALALIRMDNLYIETFEIKDVKVSLALHMAHGMIDACSFWYLCKWAA